MGRYILLSFIIYYSQAWGQLGNPPPAKPIVGVSGGDRKVTLYWNDLPEQSEDFEGYLILRSTEPAFKEVQIITDGFGNPTYYTPIAQFDKDNLWSGPHPIAVNGIKFNLGSNTGLVHTWTDSGHVSGFSLRNGQNYYYAVCSYDRGDTTLSIPPSISNLNVDYNFIYDDSNTVSIIPNAPAAGYVSPKIISDYHTSTGMVYLEYINTDTQEMVDFSYRNHFGDFLYTNVGPGTGLISIRIVDPSKIKQNHEYQVVFQDTGYFHETISYSVYNLTTGDTLIKNSNQIHSKDIQQGLVFGINFEPVGSITEQWEWGPFFDGMNIQIFNHPKVSFLESNSGWGIGGCNYKSSVEFIGNELVRIVYPADYEIMFFDHIVDSSENGSKPTNFLVWNTTDNIRSDFRFEDTDNDFLLSPGDNIFPIIYVDSNTKYPWRISFIKPVDRLQGNYLELNGISDYATAEDDSSLVIGDESHESLTVDAWIYPKSFGSYIVSDEGYSLSTVPGKGVKFEVKSGEVVHSIVKTDINFQTNRWHHVVGIFDNSANKLAIGFDGNIIWSEEDTTTFNLENTNSQLYVGTFDDTKGYFDGLIDELRISDIVRYPETNYDPDTYFFPDNSTRGLWHFNEDETSISFTDTSENGNILSAHGETKTGPTILIPPDAGDKFLVHCSKPFRGEWTNDLGETLEGDQFLFTTNAVGFNLSEAKTQLDNITVVPNPYVGAASWESNTDFGNGERKIYFIHLPPKATIRIYTISGHLVNKIEHNRPINDGAEPWDLKSKDGRDISYGVYIYHVEAPGIGNITGKFAVIK